MYFCFHFLLCYLSLCFFIFFIYILPHFYFMLTFIYLHYHHSASILLSFYHHSPSSHHHLLHFAIISPLFHHHFRHNFTIIIASITSRNKAIQPKFDQVEYRSNDDLICIKLRLIFLAQLGCQLPYIRKDNSAIIRL